jgi:hypothetical protein
MRLLKHLPGHGAEYDTAENKLPAILQKEQNLKETPRRCTYPPRAVLASRPLRAESWRR